MINKENLIISYNGDDDSDRYDLLVNSIPSWISKEKINVTLSSDETSLSTTMSHCKKLIWVKQMLKKCNVYDIYL